MTARIARRLLESIGPVLAVALTTAAGATPGGFVTAPARAAGAGAPYLVTIYDSRTSSGLRIEIVGRDGHAQRLVSRDVRGVVGGVWSPDRSAIAWFGAHGLNVERSDGSDRRVLIAPSSKCRTECVEPTFAWAPDSQRVVVAGMGPQTSRVVIVDVRTGKRVDATPAVPPSLFIVRGWSPDGSAIAYDREPYQGDSILITAAPAGTHVRSLVRFHDFHDGAYASWSPDSRWIAFTSEGRDPRDPRVAFVDSHSGAVHRLDGFSPDDFPPAWSPESDRIAVAQVTRPVVTVQIGSRNVRSLGTPGNAVVWAKTGDLTIIRGDQSREVLDSPDGTEPARLLFRLPKTEGLASINA